MAFVALTVSACGGFDDHALAIDVRGQCWRLADDVAGAPSIALARDRTPRARERFAG